MSSSVSPNFQDQKNPQSSPGLTSQNLLKFGKNTGYILVSVLVYYYFSGLALYIAKVAQANIMPTSGLCYPYEDARPNIVPNVVETNIYESKNEEKEKVSKKLYFPTSPQVLENTFKKKFPQYSSETNLTNLYNEVLNQISSDPNNEDLKKVRDYFENVYNPLSSNFENYFPKWFSDSKKSTSNPLFFGLISSIEETSCAVNVFLNYIFNLLNQIPEFLLYHFYPTVAAILLPFIIGFFGLFTILRSIINLKYFLKRKDDKMDVTVESVKWVDKQGTDYFLGLCYLIISAMVFGFPCIITAHFVAFIFIVVAFFSAASMTSSNHGSLSNSTSGFSTVWHSFKENAVEVTLVFFVTVVISSFSYLGSTGGSIILAVVATILLLKFSPFNIYQLVRVITKEYTPIVSERQAKKSCSNEGKYKEQSNPSKSLADWLLSSTKVNVADIQKKAEDQTTLNTNKPESLNSNISAALSNQNQN